MIPVKHIDPQDLPLYAMQLLPPDEMEELSLHLQHSVEARRVLSEIYGDLSIFAQSAEMQSPPISARQRMMKAVAKEKKVVLALAGVPYAAPADSYEARGTSSLLEEEPVERSAVQKVAPWLGWAIAAGVGAFSFTQYQDNQHLQNTVATNHLLLKTSQIAADSANAALDTIKDPTAVHATLTSVEAKPLPSGRVAYVPDKGSLIFIANNLAPLQPYKTYELWVIPADGRDPIPAGTFKPDEHGYASVVMPDLAKGVEAKMFGVTIEDGGGSTAPTAPILLKGSPS